MAFKSAVFSDLSTVGESIFGKERRERNGPGKLGNRSHKLLKGIKPRVANCDHYILIISALWIRDAWNTDSIRLVRGRRGAVKSAGGFAVWQEGKMSLFTSYSHGGFLLPAVWRESNFLGKSGQEISASPQPLYFHARRLFH
jgi:hypothetical protein